MRPTTPAFGVIGWATSLWQLGEVPKDVVSLLLARGGRHHIFSAIAAGDVEVIRAFVEQQPEALDQRLPARYHGQTPLHFAITRTGPTFWACSIDMGAAWTLRTGTARRRWNTRCCAATAWRRRGSAKRARGTGARRGPWPCPRTAPELADSIRRPPVVVGSKDVAATLAWYASIGFSEVARSN
jgi:hypothetical protein